MVTAQSPVRGRDPQWLHRRVDCAEELGFAVNVGELLMTECEMATVLSTRRMSRRTSRAATGWIRHERAQSDGNGAGRSCVAGPEYGEHATGPAQDEEFVLALPTTSKPQALSRTSNSRTTSFPGRTGATQTSATGAEPWLIERLQLCLPRRADQTHDPPRLLKAVAIPGYQVPFGGREMPCHTAGEPAAYSSPPA